MAFDKKILENLLSIFQSELSEQCQAMTNALVKIEQTHDTNERKNLIELIHRSAHNLKGASRGLGISTIGDIAHKMESIFKIYINIDEKPSNDIINACLDAIDKMKNAMHCFIENKSLSYDLSEYLNGLDNPSSHRHLFDNRSATSNDNHNVDIDIDYIKIPVTELNRMHEIVENIQSVSLSIQDGLKYISNLPLQFAVNEKARKDLMEYKREIDNDTIYKSNNKFIQFQHDLLNIQNNYRNHATETANLSNQLQSQMSNLRLVPASYLLYSLPRYVRDLSLQLDKKVNLVIQGEDVRLDKLVLDELRDPINHLLRNAVDHGIESGDSRMSSGKPDEGTLSITFNDLGHGIEILLADDGAGVDLDVIKNRAINLKFASKSEIESMDDQAILDILFRPGFTTANNVTDISGRGVGLDVVKENINKIHGSLNISNHIGKGLSFKIYVPMSISSERGLLLKCGTECYVIPTRSITHILMLGNEDIFEVSEHKAINVKGRTIYLYPLSQILKISHDTKKRDKYYIIVVENQHSTVAFLVDDVLSEKEIVIKPFQHPLTKIQYVSGATFVDANKLALILNVNDLISASNNIKSIISMEYEVPDAIAHENSDTRKRILVVDDSITTRTLEKNILESHNYNVTTAVDGKHAWEILQNEKFSLIITDLSMPNMDGFELTEHIKTHSETKSIPVIIVSSLNNESDKTRGVSVGADAYIVKNEFESGELIEIIEQLI